MVKHEWVEYQFNWGGYIECECGFRPNSQEDMDAHIPVLPPVAPHVDIMEAANLMSKEGSLKSLGFDLAEINRQMTEKWGPKWMEGADW